MKRTGTIKTLPPHTLNMSEGIAFDSYRVGYVAERHDVSDNCARALQLFELGYTASGAAKILDVTEGTASKYHAELQEKISPNVVMPLAGKGRDGSLDVWGARDVSDHDKLSYEDGAAEASSVDDRTVPQEQIDAEFRSPERPRNKGADLSEIPDELINIED